MVVIRPIVTSVQKRKQAIVSQNSLFSQTPFLRSTSTQFCVLGRLPDIFFFVLSFRKIGWKMWELCGVEILAFTLTRHIAYITACCYGDLEHGHTGSRTLTLVCVNAAQVTAPSGSQPLDHGIEVTLLGTCTAIISS